MKIFLDTDLNFPSDDFQALMLLLASDEVDLLGIGSCAGNTWSEEVFANLHKSLQTLESPNLPIFPGVAAKRFEADRTVALEAVRNRTRRFIGAHGKSDGPRAWVTEATPDSPTQNASDKILELSHRYSDELVLICLGPLSNLAEAIDRDDALPDRVKSLVIMGGHFPRPNDPLDRIDFNFWFDPDAAQKVLDAGFQITLVPLDVCQAAHATEELLNRCAAFARNRAALFCDDFLGMLRQHGPEMALADQLTACICLNPSLIQAATRARVTVENGRAERRGATKITEDLASTVCVVRQVDVSAAHEMMVSLVARMQDQPCQEIALFDSPSYRYSQGMHVAQKKLTLVEIAYDTDYRVTAVRDIQTARDMRETLVPLAQILFDAKRRGEIWPPSPRIDAIVKSAATTTLPPFDQLACRELEHILFERFAAVRGIATIIAENGKSCGFSCVSDLTLPRRNLLIHQFGDILPDDAFIAEFSYVERRTSGLWAAEVLGLSLYHWYATTQTASDSPSILAVTLSTQEVSRYGLLTIGYEPMAAHIIPDGPEAGRVLILYRLLFDAAQQEAFLKRLDTLGVIGLDKIKPRSCT